MFLRLYRIGDFYMFLADQGRDAVIIRRIILLQKFPLIGPPSSIGEVFLGPFYYYVVAPFLWLFQSNPVGLAVGVAVLSVLASYLIFYVVDKLVSRKAALILSVFIASSALLVDIGRFSWNPNLLPYFSFITVSLFYLALHGKKPVLYSLLFGVFFGLSFQLHHLAGLLALPVALYFLLFLWRKRSISALRIIPFSALGFLLTLLPFVVFELRHNFLNSQNLLSLFTKQNVVSSGPLLSRFVDVTTAVAQFAFHASLSPLVSCSIVVAVIISVVYMLKKQENPFITLQLITFVSLLFGLSRINAQSIPHYFHTVYISFYFLLAVILSSFSHKKFAAISIIGVVFFLFLQVNSYTFLWGEGQRQYELPERIGKQIAAKAGGNRINLTTYPTDFTSRDCYQYFIELYGGNVVDGSSAEVAPVLYVLCDKEPCRIINSDSWNVQMFGDAKIDTMWNTEGVTVYKLIHK